MTIQTPHPHLAPLLRILSMPPALMRFAPTTANVKLHTLLLRDSPLAHGHDVRFDDSCHLTVPEGQLEAVCRCVKLVAPGRARTAKGLHLALMADKGNFTLNLFGDGLRVFVGSGCAVFGSATLSAQAALFIGDGTTTAHTRLMASHADLYIGSDCQVMDDVVFEANPPCPVTDFAANEVLQPGRPRLQVGHHVLLGRRATVLAGARIGDGCVIHPGSVVDTQLPPAALAAGVPATVLRDHVGWARRHGEAPPDLKDSGIPANLPPPDDET